MPKNDYIWLQVKALTNTAMNRWRQIHINFQIKNKMRKENRPSDEQQNGNDFIADVIISLPIRERIEFIYNATRKAIEKRKEQGLPMTYKKRQMYEIGFEDAIEWLLGNEL